MIDDYDTLCPSRVKHIPLAPPRPGTPGEGIFLRLWQQWAKADPEAWRAIFVTTHRPRQRAASVAASFMVFMGCNGGAGFTYMAEQYATKGVGFNREQSFRAAWAVYNARHRGINSGLRTSEFMLAAKHPSEGFMRGVDWSRVPSITQDDNDYLESMVVWWSTNDAERLRERAKPLIEIATRMQWDSYYGRGLTADTPEIDRVKRTLKAFA